MKKATLIGVILAGVIVSASADNIVIDSIRGNGSMSFWGAQASTTARVEWAASLTDAGRTNWHVLTEVIMTNAIMSVDVPMFFRIVGQPDTNQLFSVANYTGTTDWHSGKNRGQSFTPDVLGADGSGTSGTFDSVFLKSITFRWADSSTFRPAVCYIYDTSGWNTLVQDPSGLLTGQGHLYSSSALQGDTYLFDNVVLNRTSKYFALLPASSELVYDPQFTYPYEGGSRLFLDGSLRETATDLHFEVQLSHTPVSD